MKLASFKPLAVLATTYILLTAYQAEAGANWPCWRGPQDHGSATEGTYPTTWDPEHVLWKAPLPGKGCSTPVVWERRIYLTAPTNGHDAVLTPTEGDHSYATPIVIQTEGKEGILVWGAEHLTLHDATDGKVLWSCGDFNPEEKGFLPAVASAVVVGNMAVVPYGRADRGQPRVHGIKLGGSGDVTRTHRVWKREGIGAFVPTPAAFEGRVYVLRDRGEVDCLDAAKGNLLWSDALPKTSANYYSSPVVADGKLYAAREDGVIFVARVEGKFEVLSEIKMGERTIASIVPVANRLLIRGENHLFCVGFP